MRTPDQVIADLAKAEKAVEDAVAHRDRVKQELIDMAAVINAEVTARTGKPTLVPTRPKRVAGLNRAQQAGEV